MQGAHENRGEGQLQQPFECPEVPPVSKEGSEEGHALLRHEM